MTAPSRPAGIPLIPETAPFSAEQRAWLNGFFAGLFGAADAPVPAGEVVPAGGVTPGGAVPAAETEDAPWHDPALSLAERLQQAEGRALPQRLMAAMAQLDCGQCGYRCRSYAAAIAVGTEASLSRCVPGGRETARALKHLLAEAPRSAAAAVAASAATAPAAVPRRSAVAARLLSAACLTKAGSEKEARHIALDIAGTALAYEAGDSLGVVAENCPDLVAAICGRLGASGAEGVPCPDGVVRPFAEALAGHLDIARPSDDAIALFRDRALDPADATKLETLLEGLAGDDLAEIDLFDLLALFPAKRIAPAELAARLPPLQPRLYSISSSPKAHPGEVHLTVSAVRWQRRGRGRKGVASTFLADRIAPGAAVQVYTQPSHGFRPPPDDTPMIMIGPGTGIAPFRAFLAERAAVGARGRNWLFFGGQRRATDYLYEAEIEAFRAGGVLTRLDLAFSRDPMRKVYVQDRMREHAAEIWAWLGDGAHVYVCGDARRMARDVHHALIDIAAVQGRLALPEAEQWLAELARAGRYRRDVY